MPITCIKKEMKKGKKKTRHATRAVFDRARHSLPPFRPPRPLAPSPSLFQPPFFSRRRAAPETLAVGGETFFHGRGCAPTCGMRHGPSAESFLMTGKTTDRTWTRTARGEGRLCVFRIFFLLFHVNNQLVRRLFTFEPISAKFLITLIYSLMITWLLIDVEQC